MSNGGGNKKASSGFHFVAGLGSGCTTAFILQPADLLKTRVQQSRSSTLREALRQILNGPHPVRQLWRGTTPSVIRTGFGSALYFGMLNQMRTYATRVPEISTIAASVSHTSPQKAIPQAGGAVSGTSASPPSALPKLGSLANLTSGALARVAAGFIMNPVTVLKVRYESSYYAYTSMASAAKDIVAKEGIRGFFAGFGATAVRDAPYAGLYVLVYEKAKTRIGALKSAGLDTSVDAPVLASSSKLTINFVSGVIAAVSATTMTNPFDAIKTRLQLMPGRYNNMLHAATRMLREEGVRSFFDGLSLRIGRKALSSALAWTVYEELIRRAEQRLV